MVPPQIDWSPPMSIMITGSTAAAKAKEPGMMATLTKANSPPARPQ